MKVVFSSKAWQHYQFFVENDPQLLAKVNALIGECLRHPFKGTGKPEPLKQQLKGWWSRRIDREHRLVYRVAGAGDAQALEIAQCRFHY